MSLKVCLHFQLLFLPISALPITSYTIVPTENMKVSQNSTTTNPSSNQLTFLSQLQLIRTSYRNNQSAPYTNKAPIWNEICDLREIIPVGYNGLARACPGVNTRLSARNDDGITTRKSRNQENRRKVMQTRRKRNGLSLGQTANPVKPKRLTLRTAKHQTNFFKKERARWVT